MKLKDIGDPDASDDAAEPDPTEAADDEPAEEPEEIFNSSTGVPLATHDYNGWRLAYCKNDITDVHRNTAIVLTRLRKKSAAIACVRHVLPPSTRHMRTKPRKERLSAVVARSAQKAKTAWGKAKRTA